MKYTSIGELKITKRELAKDYLKTFWVNFNDGDRFIKTKVVLAIITFIVGIYGIN